MIGVGVIGYGYWGPNLVRNLSEVEGASVISVSDLSAARLKAAQQRYPSSSATSDWKALVQDPRVDAVVIATPVSCHFEMAKAALEAGKHVLVEKPLAMTSGDCMHLIEAAQRRNLVLMVDHTFIYTAAVQRMHDLVHDQSLGDIYYYDSVRVNLGLFQHDVSVLWDLAVHDLSIMDYVLPARAVAVSAVSVSHIPGKPASIGYMTVFFENRMIGHIHVNWLAPVKVRRTLVGGSRKMIVYDDLEPSEKIKIYDKGVTTNSSAESVYQMLIGYRLGDMWAPQLATTEGLRTEVQQFIRCVETSGRPVSDGEAGLRVVQLLEAAERSARERGNPVECNQGQAVA